MAFEPSDDRQTRDTGEATQVDSDKVAFGMTVELSNLLTVIQSNLEKAERLVHDARVRKRLDYGRDATDRAVVVVRQLLALSRPETERN